MTGGVHLPMNILMVWGWLVKNFAGITEKIMVELC